MKILIVGERNVARSFLAETILRGILSARGRNDIEVISRGLVVLFSEPVSLAVLNILKKHNYNIEAFRSTQLEEEDFEGTDLILTMSKEQELSVKEQLTDHDIKCFCLSEFIDSDEQIKKLSKDTEEASEAAFRQMEEMMTKAADRIEREF